jgi:hypothetical protein
VKNPKTFLLALLLIIPLWNLMAASRHVTRYSSHKTYIAVEIPSDMSFSADMTQDDDVLYAEDDDGDDVSETLIRLLPSTCVAFVFVESSPSCVAHFFQPVPVTVRKNSPSYLRVFRI